MRMVECATNPFGYRVHASEVLKYYTPDKNQATLAQYHISDHNFNFDMSHWYGLEIGNYCQHSVQRLSANHTVCKIAS